jgi:hypothetical protein
MGEAGTLRLGDGFPFAREGFCRPGNRVGLPGLDGGAEGIRTDGHRGAGRSRATESDGGQARRLQLTRANGDCGVDGVNSVGDPEPERTGGWSWFRGDWCGCATA